MKELIFMVVLCCITSFHLDAQSFSDFCDRDTTAFDFPTHQTLCEQFGGNEPDRVIGEDENSITFASQLPNLGSFPFNNLIWGENVRINGRLIIDINLSIYFCNVSMGPGAWISVVESNRLFSRSSNYFACDRMWRGISITGESSLSFLYCNIEDAQYAMSCDGSSSLYLLSNTFNRNYVGVRNLTTAAGSSRLLFTHMVNNLFTCTGILNEPYVGQTPDPGLISHAGLLLNHAISTIGDVRNDNDFTRMEYGIHATNSDIAVSRCHFERMVVTDATADSGMGIYADDGTVVVSDVFVNDLNMFIGASTFTENDGGIFGLGADLRIVKADFQSNENFGILSVNNFISEQVDIISNTLIMDAGDTPFGISVYRSIAASGLHNQISFNTLDQVLGGISITLIGGQAAIDQSLVSSNTITLDGQTAIVNGILTAPAMTHNTTTSSNSIDFLGTCVHPCNGSRLGISAVGSSSIGGGHSISSNTISGLTGGIAIDGRLHQNTLYCSNSVDSTHIGFEFSGDNSPMGLHGNNINHHAIGLLLNPGAILGEQVRTDNRWLPNDTDYDENGALNESSRPDFSLFIVQNTTPGIMPPEVVPSTGWFVPIAGPLNSNCAFDGSPLDDLSDAETAFLEGNLSTQDADTSFIWDISFGLMVKMHHNPSLISANDLVDSFYQVVYNSSAYKLAEFYDTYEDVALADTNLLKAVSSSSDEIFIWLDSLRIIDTLYSDEGDSLTLDSAYLSAYSIVSDQLISEIHLKDSLANRLDSIRSIGLNAMLDTINGLETQGDFEWNKKTVLRYRILQLLDDVLQSDRDSLIALANLCPEDYGSAVIDARVILPLCHDQHIAKPDGWCDIQDMKLPDPKNNYLPLEMQLNPNPAEDFIMIQFNELVTGRLLVLDMSGKSLLERQLYDVIDTQIDCSKWMNGMYLVRFESKDVKAAPVVRKLVIQKN